MQSVNEEISDLVNDFPRMKDNILFPARWSNSEWNKMITESREGNAEYHRSRYGNKSVNITKASDKCTYKKCDGSGWIVIAYPPYGYKDDYPYATEGAMKCICSGGKEASEFRKIHSMIPFEYLDKRGRDFKWSLYGEDITEQRLIANTFIKNYSEFNKDGKGLYIYSAAKGSGKTFLSCCLANELSEKGVIVKFINMLDLIDLCRKTFDKNAYKGEKDTYQNELDALFNAGMLIIDDLGCENDKENGWISEMLLRLINARQGKKKIIIYTSNIPPEKLRYDDRITSRIQEASINIKLPDESIRSRMAKEKNDEFLKSLMEVRS